MCAERSLGTMDMAWLGRRTVMATPVAVLSSASCQCLEGSACGGLRTGCEMCSRSVPSAGGPPRPLDEPLRGAGASADTDMARKSCIARRRIAGCSQSRTRVASLIRGAKSSGSCHILGPTVATPGVDHFVACRDRQHPRCPRRLDRGTPSASPVTEPKSQSNSGIGAPALSQFRCQLEADRDVFALLGAGTRQAALGRRFSPEPPLFRGRTRPAAPCDDDGSLHDDTFTSFQRQQW